jgi:hypothetical protein
MSVRLAALGGAVFFALLVAFGSLTSGTPSATDSPRETFNYLSAHQGRLRPCSWGLPCRPLFVPVRPVPGFEGG